jgi:hypothetical protein
MNKLKKMLVNRREFLYFLSISTFFLTQKISCATPISVKWESIRKVDMKGRLKAFWNIFTADNQVAQQQAIKHGFHISDTFNCYVNFDKTEKEDIFRFIRTSYPNSWVRPPFFERIVKKSIEKLSQNGSIFVHDIEISFERDPAKAWVDSHLRKLANSNNFDEFAEKYFEEWAKWFSLPCRWSKELEPNKPVGIYGIQPFNSEFWGFKYPSELTKRHQNDLKLWKHIDPYVDFYVVSGYLFLDTPDSLYNLVANIEENYHRCRQFGDKPIYVFVWLRYHPINKHLSGQEIAKYQAEAIAVLPFFAGAKGIVLWGWEPKSEGQFYQTLPTFIDSLSRVSNLSAKIDRAELILEYPAYKLWKEKKPLIRKLKVTEKEWIIMVTYPWQGEKDHAVFTTKCGSETVRLKIIGRGVEIYHLNEGLLKRIS